jgi:hypothetical protein
MEFTLVEVNLEGATATATATFNAPFSHVEEDDPDDLDDPSGAPDRDDGDDGDGTVATDGGDVRAPDLSTGGDTGTGDEADQDRRAGVAAIVGLTFLVVLAAVVRRLSRGADDGD